MADDLFQVVEKLEKTRTLARRGATAGERAAAMAAVERLRARLLQFRAKTVSAEKPEHHTFTMAVSSLAQTRIVVKMVAEKGGRVLHLKRGDTSAIIAEVPYRMDALTIQTLTEYYCDDLDDQLRLLAAEFVRGATQKLGAAGIETLKAESPGTAKDLAWRFATKHERNVFGSIALACGKSSFRVASDAKSVMKIKACNESEASHLFLVLDEAMRRFKRAMVALNHGFLHAIQAT